jgi:predicted permease
MKHAVRQLLKSPTYTLLAVGALALGIGANTVLFSAINTLFLRPLAYPQPDRLVRIYSQFPDRGLERAGVSWPRFEMWREQQDKFSDLAAQAFTGFTLTGRGDPEQVPARRVTHRFFTVLGVQPLLGRAFTPQDDIAGGPDVVLLSHGYWNKRFAGKPDIIGQAIVLNGRPHTVIGVMPQIGFPFDQNQIWAPRVFELERLPRDVIDLGTGYLNVVGRLKPGVLPAQAAEQLRVIHQRYGAAKPENIDAKTALSVIPLQEDLVGNQRPMFLTLLGAVGCVLLIACCNVANLLLARFAGRRKEIAIRAALGATRGRIIGQFLQESVLTAALAGALGLLLAVWGLDVLAHLGANFIPRAHELHLDGRVLGFAVTLSLLTGVALGLVPALQASSADAAETLKDSARGSTGGRRAGNFRAALLVSEVALSLVLLMAAALLVDSFRRLQRVDPGFKPENVTTFFIGLPTGSYPTVDRQALFFEQALEKIRALPGVTAVAATNGLPIVGGGARSPAAAEGQALPPVQDRAAVRRQTITPGFFALLDVPLKQGRDFTWRDRDGQPYVVIINETLARRLYQNENPVGRRLITGIGSIPREIVGVVGDFRAVNLTEPPAEQMFYPSAQLDGALQNIVVRSARPAASLRGELVAAVHALDPGLPVDEVQPLTQLLAQAIANRRLMMVLLGSFAALALVLAGMGIYSVIAYSVAQRTNEFGIRMALGAAPRQVIGMVMREGLTLVGLGLVVGVGGFLLLALFLTRFVQNFLFGVDATNPVIFGGVAFFLTVIAAFACFIPARRATKVDPMTALRAE